MPHGTSTVLVHSKERSCHLAQRDLEGFGEKWWYLRRALKARWGMERRNGLNEGTHTGKQSVPSDNKTIYNFVGQMAGEVGEVVGPIV